MRTRNENWLDANSMINEAFTSLDLEIQYDNRSKLSATIRESASMYVRSVKTKKIVLFETKRKTWKFLNYKHRLDPSYVKNQIKKLNIALYPFKKTEYGLFLTLTTGFRDFRSIGDSFAWIQKEVNNLFTKIRKKWKIYYVRVAEIQSERTKQVHFHILIMSLDPDVDFDTEYDFLEFQKFVKDNWKYYSDLKKVARGSERKKGGRGIVGYLVKYIVKIFKTETGNISETMAILWALGARTYSSTRLDYAESVKNNSNEGDNTGFPEQDDKPNWVYIGALSGISILAGEYSEDEIALSDPELLTRLYIRLYS